ncbi:MAG: alkaline phosphatase D family protein [Actinomycetota bacterium]|nr:alkaline phosphatase D family protein [Actinomycetota bacterium]
MPTELPRRQFLAGAGAVLAAPMAARRLGVSPRGQAAPAPFPWGVASFDPTPDSVLLWTRVDASAGGEVRWEVATDDGFAEVVAQGSAVASAASDHCVTVDATGLSSGQVLWYRFTTADGTTSTVGRTRTVAVDPDRVRIALVSCARFTSGGYAVYRALADRDVDVVVHVGDYIYEDGRSAERAHDPSHRCTTLDDYRTRYAQYRSDPDLQHLHASHPMVATWDDHESAGNAWRDGAVSHGDGDGPWPQRLAAASQAREEWVPGRTERVGGRLKLWRTLELGGLADLVVLDTRTWGRDRQARSAEELAEGAATRQLLGADQSAWLTDQLSGERKPWTFIANQVMFHPLQVPALGDSLDTVFEARNFLVTDEVALNPDQWDGYEGARAEVLDAVGDRGGVVVLTGDVHSSWAWNGPSAEPNGPAGMVELVTPSVTTDSFGSRIGLSSELVQSALRLVDSELAYVELDSHGYVLADVTADRLQAEWWYVDPSDPATQRFGAGYETARAFPMRLRKVDEPTSDDRATPAPAPSTTTAPVEDDDEGVGIALPAAGAAVIAGTAAAVALRRRRTREDPTDA